MADQDGFHPAEGRTDLSSGPNQDTIARITPSFEPSIFETYLRTLLPVVLGATEDDLERSLFAENSKHELVEKVERFCGGANVGVVYVNQVRDVSDVEGEDPTNSTPTFSYQLTSTLSYAPQHVASLALIKRTPLLDQTIPLSSQLSLLNLFGPGSASGTGTAGSTVGGNGLDGSGPGGGGANDSVGTPYESLHQLVHWGVGPWFEAFVNSRNGGQDGNSLGKNGKAEDGKMGSFFPSSSINCSLLLRSHVDGSLSLCSTLGIPMTKKKFAELELSLLHLQQNVEIPETTLAIHPVVVRAVERCHSEGTRVRVDSIEPASLLTDASFLNKLQTDVNKWIKEIQSVTKLNRDVASGTASQEINFWLSMERALEGIEAQLSSEPVVLALDILKHAKRFHATVSFIADTGLKEATKNVHSYNQLMKDFPLNDLLAATDLERMQDSILSIFKHLSNKLKLSPYPIERALQLAEAISRDLNAQLTKVLTSQKLMYMEYNTFEKLMVVCQSVFNTWDDMMKEFIGIARELTRKRSERFMQIRVLAAHAKLQEKLSYLRVFRKQHEQLSVMTGPTKGLKRTGGDALTDIDMEEEVKAAYELVKHLDVLDVSPAGAEIWLVAEGAYNDRVARVENQIIARLRDRLGTARNANEMFRVFSKFNSLLVRQKIRGAIQEYQTQLIESVKDDIKRLHQKFTTNYRHSEAFYMSQMRDLPPVAGAIIWARQIERQLAAYMQRVEDVLGKGWELYAEGQRLQSESASFRKKLDTNPLYEAWKMDIIARELKINGRLFDVTRSRSNGNQFRLAVNFDPQIITLFKEVRNLIWLNFAVPHQITVIAKDAKKVYPYAVSLMETVRTYTQTTDLINVNPKIVILLADYRNDVQQMIARGMPLRWEMFINIYDRDSKHLGFVREFASVISVLQDKTNSLIETHQEITRLVDELSTRPYDSEALSDVLDNIQKIIDRMNLEGYANLDRWVSDLDQQIEQILLNRLRLIIRVWCTEFSKTDDADLRRNGTAEINTKRRVGFLGDAPKDSEKKVEIVALVHEVRIQNQVIYLDPPIEHARASWIKQLQGWLAVVCGLKRIQSSRYEIGLQMKKATEEELTYISLLTQFNDSTLEEPFKLIEMKVQEVGAYVAKWLQFQSLWDLVPDQVYNRLGNSLSNWAQLLSEIKKTRSTFDNSDTQRSFGICVIDYAMVQSKVNSKYDTWQRDILSRYGSMLGTTMRDVHIAILKARHDLEHLSIEGSSTAQAVTFITFVQDLKKKVVKWSPEIAIFVTGQQTLERQRYQFPNEWLYVDQVQGEWSAFNEILKRKDDSIQKQLAGLQMKIIAEDKIISNKITELVSDWESNKPIQGDIKADTAMNTVNVFEGRLSRLEEEFDLVHRAKGALDLDATREDRLSVVLEELRDLKAVWTALSGVWAQIADIREMNWTTIQPRKLRHQLDGLLTFTKEMPSRMRQYSAFEFVQNTIRTHLKTNTIISELKSEALRERHWRQLFKILKSSQGMASLTLGQVYDLNLKKNEMLIKEVITQAAGEMALEEYLKQVRETWTSYTLDLIQYQNKCRLIRGWDDLFTKCGENLNSLQAMKMSPYYKVFEDEASSWEEKLNRVHVLFDVWIDVQRQWVYLEGIFSGSADIKHLLPVESARFANINTEFLTVMKKVYKSPYVLDVLNIQGVQKSLERLADLLSKIQKALGEYLERERATFPRFYFVGDEDLLEIIGNSKDIVRIMKHLKKMFAGLSALILDEEHTTILGMASREGEEIIFVNTIELKNFPRINDWLLKIESEMKLSLATLLLKAVGELESFYSLPDGFPSDSFLAWTAKFPAQLVVLAIQCVWTRLVENALSETKPLDNALSVVSQGLDLLADTVLTELPPIQRRKCEHLITELVHQRDVTRSLKQAKIVSNKSFEWLYHMRFYFDTSDENPLERLKIHMANASFAYGYEYLGIPDRLVQTPLTDRCYLTLTQALDSQLGGSPFGPAGTGKTESVKALGVQLGRFVLVFCCDENFDFQAMGRIFVGLCQVGAWGCFDEFNRLEERILSAVSQQVQSIQQGLALAVHDPNTEIELVGKQLKVNTDTGIFITMNPGYAGRSNLPDNLKKLFRSMAMTKPDLELIAQVMLFSQGFRTAETLASKIVPFFNLCAEQLSPQPHYDFGLRALKAVLISAGLLKRERLISTHKTDSEVIDPKASDLISEQEILIQSVIETIVPKLVADDVSLLMSLLSDVFPGINYVPINLDALKAEISKVCAERHLVMGELWVQKVVQLYQIHMIQHGLMMVGPSGSGKTEAWKVLLKALERLDGIEGVAHVIDPKAIPKDALYGTLDPTTREWNDGLFTHILRKIVDNVRGESTKRHWIIFDGDVDPEWVENLNSVLDDNKLLTLPNGERLNLTSNVRIMFEVEHLKYATLATVSRCGMVWFSEDIIKPSMFYQNYLDTLGSVPLDAEDEEELGQVAIMGRNSSLNLSTQRSVVSLLHPFFADDGLVNAGLQFAETIDHIMEFTQIRALNTLFSLINKSVWNILEYNNQHPDFPLSAERIESYIAKRMLVDIIWAFSGDAKLERRIEMGEFLRGKTGFDLPPASSGTSIIDYDVAVSTGEWSSWQAKVPVIDIDTHMVTSADVVVPTIDTVRHEQVIYSWLSEHKPLMLCGPPGSGKTMTLFSALRKLPQLEVVGLNFSSATTPELILKTFEQYCEYRKTPNGILLAPTQIGRWLVVFCDEINLPAIDKYGTQRVISFIRQLVESGGFWRTSDMAWVKLERIQFVGACNPPTDPGRVPLSHRFLRHAPLIMVDYPGEISLNQIYGTFNRALLKVIPNLRAYAEPLTEAMVSFYIASQARFTADIQAHYIYSPRELTRWMRGIYEAIRPLESLSVEGLVRIWAHEALRLFQDRLVTEAEKKWTDDILDTTAENYFPSINHAEALVRPILFSNWTSRNYLAVDREELREYTKARLRVFHEEELDVQLVLFNDVLDHVLRIDRAFRQVQGHMLLIGVSGSGKTTLSRFVAWMNGLSIFQIKVSNHYNGDDFDEDLRTVLRRSGCKGEKICFIMDESNVLDSGFLERMNTLLANAEVPGLFEGDDYSALMTACKEGSQRDGLMLDSHEELYRWFTDQVAKNLHVVFTMNPPENGLASRAATSPALFNRCVLDWFGDWSDQAFYQVGYEFTQTLDLDIATYEAPSDFPVAYRDLLLPPTHRLAVVNALVYVHQSLYSINARLIRQQGRYNHVTPRHYLDFIDHYVRLFNEKRDELEEQQRHLNIGLDKLRDTVTQVEDLRRSLAIKKTQLEAKDAEANDKLKRMVTDQQEAEQKKAASIEIQAALAKQDAQIKERSAIVMSDLAEAEPAVLEAQAAVSNIRKQHLTEVRSMANPPEAVKVAMESVCTVLGHKFDSWKTVQGLIRREDFIPSITSFDTSKMTRQLRDKMAREYLSRPGYTFEVVDRASKACGPLVKWVIAQVRFSDILDKVEPLRNEVQYLEDQAEQTKHQASTIIELIDGLESSIAQYKDEYALLISETQAIRSEMDRVRTKVDRSVTLLDSLSSEKERWELGSKTFESEMSTIVGDVLLSAAFLAYGGFFDQQYRELMWMEWCDHLSGAGIHFKPELSLPEYLSTADDRISWQAKSLPSDTLSVENAIMLKRFNRYPLIIDPTGQATTYLVNEYKDRKITVTSFLDEAFLKNLESALRFGNPILIQDVEHLDPILNAILNKEIKRTGGRVLIRLGNQDIDFSPAFTMFLSTRDPSVEFSPDICSRVTFVNFTMTRASLQSQSLDKVLKVERPDTDRKRSDLIKLQGEFRLRLRHLEKSLLTALNESSGNILDDDKVIDTLETLKNEAAEVTTKVEETDVVMKAVEEVTSEYLPLARSCSSIYFVLENLSHINQFYSFSLARFLDVFDYVLEANPNLQNISDPSKRLAIILQDLFVVVYRRTSSALLHTDRLVLAMLLSQLFLRDSQEVLANELDLLLETAIVLNHIVETKHPLLDIESSEQLRLFTRAPALQEASSHMEQNPEIWTTILASSDPETRIPADLWSEESAIARACHITLLMRAIRLDRIQAAAGIFVKCVFGHSLETEDDLQMFSDQSTALTPIVLASIPGHDAAYRVENLFAETGRLISVAMGSSEGLRLAEQAISEASRTGKIVLLKNTHLVCGWLSSTLEKRLQTLRAHPNFRLFLTMETSPKIPTSILRSSRVVMNEPSRGLKATLLMGLRSLSRKQLSQGPSEKHRLYLLACFLHAVIQERSTYEPLGWTKAYEINDSELLASFRAIDSSLEAFITRTNVDPTTLPWTSLRVLLTTSIYGGKIGESDYDFRILQNYVNSVFTAEAFDGAPLVAESALGPALSTPEGTNVANYLEWANDLPDRNPTSWLGLTSSAASTVATAQGRNLLQNLRKMVSVDEGDVASPDSTKVIVDRPVWMQNLLKFCKKSLSTLPKSVSKPLGDSNDTIFRYFIREYAVAKGLLSTVVRDVETLVGVIEGTQKQTNDIRALITYLTKETVPPSWSKFKMLRGSSASQFIASFSMRLNQLEKVSREGLNYPITLSLLFAPTAYLSATQQYAARSGNQSLERFELVLDIGKQEGLSFQLSDAVLQGATYHDSALRLIDGTTKLSDVYLRWQAKPEVNLSESDTDTGSTASIRLPVYLNSDRSDLLFSCVLPIEGDRVDFVKRSVALIA
ncbi:dynein heavy chain cytosolic [Phaffia rhodozyma]|uniref:Dynein heavy chain, cytoplasmic n=1 Tax=Phaffia rhodozyma TaxID=264483 RepID=A0A0F7SU36_PHARH|nr:dynein heavy chain cytosolic [Phaffia rhodozyma]